MNNILNVRVKRLIKDDLLEYGKHLLGFLGFIVLSILINFILQLFFGSGEIVINIGDVHIDLGNPENFNLVGLFNMISFGAFVIIMFISGAVVGYELPHYVRMGIARTEYFIATTIAATIVSFLIAPFTLLLNGMINFIVGSNSIFYNGLHMGSGDLLTLGVQFLMYVAVFFLGLLIVAIYQRIGWQIATGLIVALFAIGIGWNFSRLLSVFNVVTGEYWFEFSWAFRNGYLGLIAVMMIVVFGFSGYTMIKNTSVDVK